jgi:adenine-specific DNA-methyltransferase
MNLIIKNPKQSLNKAFLKQKVTRNALETFKGKLEFLLKNIDISQSEEHNKNIMSRFLQKVIENKYINTKDRSDLVIHNGGNSASSVGVIIEAKKPGNSHEMLHTDNINSKAFHELILYFMRERITNNNLEIKHLIATDLYEWFVVDARVFEKLFAQNKEFVKQFKDFESGSLTGYKTDYFYNEIAKKYVSEISDEIEFTYFDIRIYQNILDNNDDESEKKMLSLYKFFSAEHLLKLPFANDSNTLDEQFYSELLHIIGLKEIKESGKKLLVRLPESERIAGSLIENTITQLDAHDYAERVDDLNTYGDTYEEQIFHIALELNISWINRILFLKLLESQLITYHKNKDDYSFLNIKKLPEYDDVDKLFFRVLAKKPDERKGEVKEQFKNIPYLNSSLFEATNLEKTTLFINELEDRLTLPVYSSTVLKNQLGQKISGSYNSLEYLFDFLDAYDFSSEGKEEIQEERKTLINASVLGLIFEKINGYKDGSFFTPGFITMYISREAIRKSVIDKFNSYYGWQCNSFEELQNKDFDIKEANIIVNSLRICDPAVGSGHFLVSALNEMIAVKNDLGIIADKSGKRLKYIEIYVANDELVVTDEDGELFEYNYKNTESSRIQETIFREKQTIIENCLFGVDINQNSVNICRLRLWIELLKNTYYNENSELETLPNIDINIKTGNSLVSKFDLYDTQITSKDKRNLNEYKLAVMAYKNIFDKQTKNTIKKTIAHIQSNFKGMLKQQDPTEKKLNELTEKLHSINTQTRMDEPSKKEITEKEKLEKEITKLVKQKEEQEQSNVYDNALEWRFEFPEVLDVEGNFTGFDIVIGNPPYIQMQKDGGRLANEIKEMNYKTYARTGDIYTIFYERGWQLLKDNGHLAFITSNKWMRAGYGVHLRKFLSDNTVPEILIDFGGVKVFESATVDTNVLVYRKVTNSSDDSKSSDESHKTFVVPFDNDFKITDDINAYISEKGYYTNAYNTEDSWLIANETEVKIKQKIEAIGTPLKDWDVKINYGIKTGYNEAFIIDGKKKDELIADDPKSAEIIKPILRGRDIKRYKAEFADLWLLFIPWHFPLHNDDSIKGASAKAEKEFEKQYPAIYNHLLQHKDKLEKRNKAETGIRYEWYALQRCAATYYEEFEKEKIVWASVGKNEYCFVPKSHLLLDTNYFAVGLNRYVLSILNSKLIIKKFIESTDTRVGTIAFRHYKYNFEKIPIPKISETDQQPFIELVEQILAEKEADADADTTALEKEIDRLVYKLYGLSEEEIILVEGKE